MMDTITTLPLPQMSEGIYVSPMPTLLVVEASPRGEQSMSRGLTQRFVPQQDAARFAAAAADPAAQLMKL